MVKGSRYKRGFCFIGSRGSYTRDFLDTVRVEGSKIYPRDFLGVDQSSFKDESSVQSTCYAWSWVRGKRSLWVKGSRYEEGLHLVGSRGSYAREFLGKGRGFKDTS